jgi:hypothetical protein
MKKSMEAPIDKPVFVLICERTDLAFAQAAVLIRDGYSFDPANPPHTFSFGRSSIELVLSTASAAAKCALARTLHYAQEDWEWEAKDLAERQAVKAALAVEVTEAKASLKRLQAAHRNA